MWEAKVVAVGDAGDATADVAETNRKHKVIPDWGDLIMYWIIRVYILLHML